MAFVKRLRDNQGQKIQGVLSNYKGDHEGIINVTGGVLLEDGTEITPEKATAWVAGASAGATFNQSLTFVEYEGAVDVLNRIDNDEIVEREKNKVFQKNKIVRVLDAINNDLTSQLKALIKSRKASGSDVPASDDGLQFVKTLITQYMGILQDGGGITGFDSESDIAIVLNEDRDGFIIDLAVQPVDAAEKFYFNVEVK
ncbi:phage tail sheath family protein [Bacillus velezensis]